jgi:hypothetical protein
MSNNNTQSSEWDSRVGGWTGRNQRAIGNAAEVRSAVAGRARSGGGRLLSVAASKVFFGGVPCLLAAGSSDGDP